jgi:hypothetical protein
VGWKSGVAEKSTLALMEKVLRKSASDLEVIGMSAWEALGEDLGTRKRCDVKFAAWTAGVQLS